MLLFVESVNPKVAKKSSAFRALSEFCFLLFTFIFQDSQDGTTMVDVIEEEMEQMRGRGEQLGFAGSNRRVVTEMTSSNRD